MVQKSSLLATAKDLVTANTPAILTGLGVAGLISTAVLAVRGTPEALREIADAESERVTPLTFSEKVRLTWRNYTPAAAVGVVSIGAIVGAQSINHRRQAALMSAYALTETSLREYREKNVVLNGEKKDLAVMDAVAVDRMDALENREVVVVNGGSHLMCDGLSGRYFMSDIESIRKTVNDVNELCLQGENVSQNEFYSKIGLPSLAMGDDLGWCSDQLMDVHFTTKLHEETNAPALYLMYRNTPIKSYYKINR